MGSVSNSPGEVSTVIVLAGPINCLKALIVMLHGVSSVSIQNRNVL